MLTLSVPSGFALAPFAAMTRAASSTAAGSHAPAPPPGRTVLTQAEPPSTDSTSPLT